MLCVMSVALKNQTTGYEVISFQLDKCKEWMSLSHILQKSVNNRTNTVVTRPFLLMFGSQTLVSQSVLYRTLSAALVHIEDLPLSTVRMPTLQS